MGRRRSLGRASRSGTNRVLLSRSPPGADLPLSAPRHPVCYDGIFFYTYVENCGARYLDEYGFNEPIVREYERRYGVDIRKRPFNKEAWYRLRGEYMTQFIGELHSALAAKGKKLSLAIYPPTPNYPESWDGSRVDIPQGGTYTWTGKAGWNKESSMNCLCGGEGSRKRFSIEW